MENVPAFHVNDSKIPLGGRVDRHAHIGEGKIGEAAFARILRHPRFGAVEPEGLAGRAFLLETPIDDPGDDRRNVAKLWELAGIKGPAADKGFSMLTPAMRKMKKELEKKGKNKSSAKKDSPQRTQRAPSKKAKRKAKTKKDV